MSFLNDNENAPRSIGALAAQLVTKHQNGDITLSAESAGHLMSMESLDNSSAAALKSDARSIQNVLQQVFSGAVDQEGNPVEISPVSLEAATIGLMGCGDLRNFHRQTTDVNVSTEGADYVAIPGLGSNGSCDYTMNQDLVLGLEAFETKDLTVIAAYTAGWNIGATRQDSYAEAWYPTHVMNADQTALDMKVPRLLLFKGSRRNASADALDWQMTNALEAFRNHTLVETKSTELIPYVTQANADKFIDAALVAPSTILVDDVQYVTAPLALDKNIDLVQVSQNPGLISGEPNHTDQLDSQAGFSALYLKISNKAGDQVSTIKYNTKGFNNSWFVKSPTDDWMKFQVSFAHQELVIDGDTKSVANAAIPALAALKAAGYRIRLDLFVNGTLNLQTGHIRLTGKNVDFLKVTDADGKVMDMASGAIKAILDDLVVTVEAFDPIARRTNSNKRTRGLLMDRNVKIDRYPIPVGAPLSANAPYADEGFDSQALDTLIQLTNIRNSLTAVTRQLNQLESLEQYCKANKDVAAGERQAMDIEGAGRWLVTPFFERVQLDLYAQVQSLKSQDRTVDVSSVIVNVIRDVAYRMMRDMNYLPVLQTYTQGADKAPRLLLGTDLILPQYIQVQGDPRTMGIGMEFEVVSSPDTRLENKIIGAFSRKGRVGPDLLSWGTHLWMSEVVQLGPVARDGTNIRELQVQPRNLHAHFLPGGFIIEITNLEKALTVLKPVVTTVAP